MFFFFATMITTASSAASLVCTEAGGMHANLRIGPSKLTVLSMGYGATNFGDFQKIAETPRTLTFYRRPQNSNNGIPLLIRVPSLLRDGAVGMRGKVSVTFTDVGQFQSVRQFDCRRSTSGRNY
jgi:hypothetical protein